MDFDLDTIRRAGISRRGGVRVRGGRLPPIRMRDIPLTNPKKVVAPKIPQRRIKIKQEIPEPYDDPKVQQRDLDQKGFKKDGSRGKGRGAKVYLQTEGIFLGEGLSLKLKKESQVPSYERVPRGCSNTRKMEDMKLDARQIKDLLESSKDTEDYLDYRNSKQPVRLPFVKKERNFEAKKKIPESADIKPIIKEEPNEDIKLIIKEEPIDDIKLIIKEEPKEDIEPVKKESSEFNSNQCGSSEEQLFNRVKIDDSKADDFLDGVNKSQDEDVLILFQLPSCLPFKKREKNENPSENKDKSSKPQEKTDEESKVGSCIKDVSEGHIGKLQFLKSGEMRLVLGSVLISVEKSMESDTFYEAVSIPIDKDEGDLIVLGKVDQKMIMRPLLNHMIEGTLLEEDIFSKTFS